MGLKIRTAHLSDCHLRCVFERLPVAIHIGDLEGAQLVFQELLKRALTDSTIQVSVQENGYLLVTECGSVLVPLCLGQVTSLS